MTRFSLWPGRSRHEKAADAYRPQLAAINALSDQFRRLSDADLKAKVTQHRGRDLAAITAHLPEVFAAVREVADRTLHMRHFDVQIIGGLALLEGKIAEMKTGEGKTLVATLPLVVHGLVGRGAHLVTVNDYLARRDADWMRPVYEFFDLSVGVVVPGMDLANKRLAYEADITYGTNNEFGFDYLRDNMAQRPTDMVQRDLVYAIVDEVDSILIDEARTPLIISAPDAESTQLYERFARLVPQLQEDRDYNIDEKRRAATLTDAGISKIEKLLGITNIYEERGIRLVHHLEQALRANSLYHRDKDYVVQDGQVIIVDEFTGRLMHGRRYSEGLHQAIEAKEGVPVQQESRTLATITFQNFFRLYHSLAGMTGTAVTSAEEFEKVYNLEVVVVPTNKPLVRKDKPDRIYINEAAKFAAVVKEIKQRHQAKQPILVGTIAIEKSEHLSALLSKEGIEHEVLNAKNHAREADIIAQAGQLSAVTISTNMAGRGTDIKLGAGVKELGGLFVLGTERHEARRIDNQLRGRAGRQGDPGQTQFFISLEDDVMRIFGGERIKKLMQRLKLPEDQPIENRMVSRAIEGAQERVEGYYFDLRKQVLAYDDVLNRQRDAIYTLRRGVLTQAIWKQADRDPQPIHDHIQELVREQAANLVAIHTGEGQPERWDIEEMSEVVHSVTGAPLADVHTQLRAIINQTAAEGPDAARTGLVESIEQTMLARLTQRQAELGEQTLADLEKAAILRAIDVHWMDHLDTMDYLRTGIGLRGYGQRDPLVEYQREGHRLFQQLLATIKSSIVEVVFKAQAVRAEQVKGQAHHQSTTAPHRIAQAVGAVTPHAQPPISHQSTSLQPATGEPLRNPYKSVGRNDPCPCGATKPDGSAKKFKHCHGNTT